MSESGAFHSTTIENRAERSEDGDCSHNVVHVHSTLAIDVTGNALHLDHKRAN